MCMDAYFVHPDRDASCASVGQPEVTPSSARADGSHDDTECVQIEGFNGHASAPRRSARASCSAPLAVIATTGIPVVPRARNTVFYVPSGRLCESCNAC